VYQVCGFVGMGTTGEREFVYLFVHDEVNTSLVVRHGNAGLFDFDDVDGNVVVTRSILANTGE